VISKTWLKHGSWNTLEQAFTRILDALSTLVLLWALQPEVFSKLALAQAWISPVLLFFVSPESIMYRDFGRWTHEGGHVVAKQVRALRNFGWCKTAAAFLFSAIIAGLTHSGPRIENFYAIFWAFILVLSPQVMGADREFLRLSLRLKELNVQTLIQKALLLGGTILVALFHPSSLAGFFWVALFSLLISASWIAFRVEKVLRQDYPKEQLNQPVSLTHRQIIWNSIHGFSFWGHISGVIWGWTQTMDVFFLGLFSFPAREIGLYASALKIGNLIQALPLAVQNIFSVWLGRRTQLKDEKPEKEKLLKLTGLIALLNLIQWCGLVILSPWILRLLSRGRWQETEIETMRHWLAWIAAGFGVFSIGVLGIAWIVARMDVKRALYRVYIPWLVISLAGFAAATHFGGPTGAASIRMVVSISFLALMLIFKRKHA
jgi:hypothetical protein